MFNHRLTDNIFVCRQKWIRFQNWKDICFSKFVIFQIKNNTQFNKRIHFFMKLQAYETVLRQSSAYTVFETVEYDCVNRKTVLLEE